MWQRFDEILFLTEKKYLDRELPARNLAKRLSERFHSIFKIRNKAPAFHFVCVGKKQEVIG